MAIGSTALSMECPVGGPFEIWAHVSATGTTVFTKDPVVVAALHRFLDQGRTKPLKRIKDRTFKHVYFCRSILFGFVVFSMFLSITSLVFLWRRSLCFCLSKVAMNAQD